MEANNLFNFISDHSGEEGTGQGGGEEHLDTSERDQPQEESELLDKDMILPGLEVI